MLLLANIFLLAVLGTSLSNGFPHGAPAIACRTMRPVHSGRPRTDPSPFAVTFAMPANGGYMNARQIAVNISSTTSAAFKGFILTARRASGSDEGQLVGTFVSPRRSTSTKLLCEQKAVTQSISRDRQIVTAEWTPPLRSAGPIVFTASIVESYMKFWVNVTSSQLQPIGEQ